MNSKDTMPISVKLKNMCFHQAIYNTIESDLHHIQVSPPSVQSWVQPKWSTLKTLILCSAQV